MCAPRRNLNSWPKLDLLRGSSKYGSGTCPTLANRRLYVQHLAPLLAHVLGEMCVLAQNSCDFSNNLLRYEMGLMTTTAKAFSWGTSSVWEKGSYSMQLLTVGHFEQGSRAISDAMDGACTQGSTEPLNIGGLPPARCQMGRGHIWLRPSFQGGSPRQHLIQQGALGQQNFSS